MYIYIYNFVCTCETMQECQERCIFLGKASFQCPCSSFRVSSEWYVCLVSNLSGIMSRRAHVFLVLLLFPSLFFFFCSVLFFSFFSLARVQPTRESWFRPGKICTDSSADLDPRAQKTAEEFWNTARVLSNTFIVTVFRLRNRRFNKFLDHLSFVINRLINRLINSFTDERDLLIRK